MKTTKAGRWVLLGFNLVLATAILAQPGQAASARGGDCVSECVLAWSDCVLDGGWGCSYEVGACVEECALSMWGPSDPDPFRW
ncbi:MAG: hypothetical protein OXJ54_14715 [Gemmatimonadetes bacterium]|nr:hypothetical protein [Candidatus Palauibacter rhopaloidicola]